MFSRDKVSLPLFPFPSLSFSLPTYFYIFPFLTPPCPPPDSKDSIPHEPPRKI